MTSLIRYTRKPPLGKRINWQHPLARGLTGVWILNEHGGSIAVENVNSTQNTITGGNWQNGGLFLDGVNDYIQTVLSWDERNPYSVAFKYSAPSLSVADVMMGTKSTSDNGFLIVINGYWGGANDNNRMTFWFGKSTSDRATFVDSTVDDGNDHSGLATYQGNSDGGKGVLYLDGVEKSSYTNANAGNSTQSFQIGQSSDAGGGTKNAFFNGTFQYIYIYNRELISAEAFQLHREPYAFFEPLLPIELMAFVAAAGGLSIPIAMYHYQHH